MLFKKSFIWTKSECPATLKTVRFRKISKPYKLGKTSVFCARYSAWDILSSISLTMSYVDETRLCNNMGISIFIHIFWSTVCSFSTLFLIEIRLMFFRKNIIRQKISSKHVYKNTNLFIFAKIHFRWRKGFSIQRYIVWFSLELKAFAAMPVERFS